MNRQVNMTFITIVTLFLGMFSSCNSDKKVTNEDSDSLRIMSYNVWYGFTKVPERKKAWIAWMKKQNPDIVSLQELNEYTHHKLAEDARSYGHAYSVLLKEEGFPTGITSRYPIEDVVIIKEGFHHGLLRVRIQQMYFYVVHLHPSNWEVRKNEIKQILRDIDGLPPESQVILAGDFNTFSPLDSVHYSHGRLEPFFNDRDSLYAEKNLNKGKLDYSVIQDVMDYGLVDLEAGSRTSSYDFSGSFPTRIEKEGEHGDQRRLDYVFASRNVATRVTRANIIATDTTLILSDHLPLVIDMLASPLSTAEDDLQLQITPLPVTSRMALTDMQSLPHIIIHKDWYNWCPSVLMAEDGKYHMFHTRWPKSIGFLSWLTHSEIVHAVADKPEGPYSTLAVAIPPTDKDRGDWFTAHNSKIKEFNNRYYLYFCQTRGDSFTEDDENLRIEMAKTGYQHPLWKNEARPNQRTFVASANSLEGPWEVSIEPIIQPEKTITTLTVNPAVCKGPDGTYYMIIKGDKPGGNGMRSQALATAPFPEGPWTIQNKPVIDNLDTEDVSMWYDQARKRFYAVFHAHTFIGMMTSADGINWEKAKQYKLISKGIPFDDGTTWMPNRMERPFVLTDEKGSPIMLFVACLGENMSANIGLPLVVRGSATKKNDK